MSEIMNNVVINHYNNMAVSRRMFEATYESLGLGLRGGETVARRTNSIFEYNVSSYDNCTIIWKDMPYHDCVHGNMKLAQSMVAMEDDYILNEVFQEAENAHIDSMDFGTCGNALGKVNKSTELIALDGYPLRHGMNLAINRTQYTELVASRGHDEHTGDEMMNVMALLRGGRIFPANVEHGCGILAPIAEYSGVMYTIKRDWQLEKCCDGVRLSLILGDVRIEEPNMIVKLEGL